MFDAEQGGVKHYLTVVRCDCNVVFFVGVKCGRLVSNISRCGGVFICN